MPDSASATILPDNSHFPALAPAPSWLTPAPRPHRLNSASLCCPRQIWKTDAENLRAFCRSQPLGPQAIPSMGWRRGRAVGAVQRVGDYGAAPSRAEATGVLVQRGSCDRIGTRTTRDPGYADKIVGVVVGGHTVGDLSGLAIFFPVGASLSKLMVSSVLFPGPQFPPTTAPGRDRPRRPNSAPSRCCRRARTGSSPSTSRRFAG